MKRNIIILGAMVMALTTFAQTSRQEIKENIFRSGSNYYAYPGPTQQRLTPAPKGYEPFYISHYGRHGSRHLIGEGDYNNALKPLQKAADEGKLTQLGLDVLARVQRITDDAYLRHGELTLLGAQQHQGIAHRMYERFPEVFRGKTNIDARSTPVIRCILSMENAMQELKSLNPELCISHDGSYHDKWYLNYETKEFDKLKENDRTKKAYKEFCTRHEHHDRLMNSLFNDEDYWRKNVDASNLNYHLFKLASNLQSTELRHDMTLYDLFTEEEIYDNWLQTNAWWYIHFGPCPLNDCVAVYSQTNLLRDFIAAADTCLTKKHPGATLRYGHEVCVMPMACLLELDNFGKQIEDLEQLDDEGWINYKIFPMGSNIQMVFYRSKNANEPILMKVLLNENEMHLPLTPVDNCYYKWSDFRDYFTRKLDIFEQKVQLKKGPF